MKSNDPIQHIQIHLRQELLGLQATEAQAFQFYLMFPSWAMAIQNQYHAQVICESIG